MTGLWMIIDGKKWNKQRMLKVIDIYLMQIVFDDSRLKFSVRELSVRLRFDSDW